MSSCKETDNLLKFRLSTKEAVLGNPDSLCSETVNTFVLIRLLENKWLQTKQKTSSVAFSSTSVS